MQIKPRDVLFVGIIIVVVGGLFLLSKCSGHVPDLAATPPEHQTARLREDCLKCHVPEKMGELEAARQHPLKWRDAKVNCLQCHKAPAPQKAQAPSPVFLPDLNSQISNLRSSSVWQKQQ